MTEAGFSLRPARSVRAIQDITDQIREELRAGRLRPGQRLPAERELAKVLGVGRNTVREAMSMLEVSGLIERRPGTTGGAFIRASTGSAVADRISDGMMLGRYSTENIIEARLALETFIARQACKRGTDEEFDALSANIERTAAIPTSSWEEKLASYGEFLQIFVGAARNPLLSELAKPLVESTAALVRRIGPPKRDNVLDIRRKLVAALKERDPDKASELVAQAMVCIRKSWASRS
jgi:GntR family transcriptional regulator, transcriptional repressor for pyruvate dehydrogenase complex